MTTKGASLSFPETSSGASELIGGVLMITVVVAAVAIIGVALFSQPAPQSVPNINFMTGTDAADSRLFLYHNGGDTLKRGEFAVVIDNDPPRTDYTISGGGDEWSVGKNLMLGVTGAPQTVSVVYYGANGGTILLRSASSSVAALQKDIGPSNTPIPVGGGTGGYGYIFNDAYNISNSSQFIQAIQENVSANRINFYKNSLAPSGGLGQDTSLSLRVKDTQKKSLIIYNNNLVKLNNTDIVSIKVISQTRNFKMFGIAPQIWEMAGDRVDLTITRTAPVSSIYEKGVSISHTWINNYELVSSSLVVDTTGSSVTALTVNHTQYLPVPPLSTDSRDIKIISAKPLPVGLYLLVIDDSQKTAYFVGTADQICIGTNCGPYGL
jgi:hypothetical protein